jgi:outer membrane protein OmpA-like peptidoglycan-associated protein
MNGNLGELQKQNQLLASQFKQCSSKQKQVLNKNKDLKDAVKNIGRKIASLKRDLRSNIADKLAKMFKDNNVRAKVDPVTGNVTLDLGKNFLFRKNSYRISRGAKKQLKKIIPIYAEVLFSDGKVSDQIASFNIEGHASPVYRGKYLKPNKINTKAYSYNMLLSGQRAASISSFMFGRKIGSYKYKVDLKTKTRAVGYGYTQPVKFKGSKKRSIASKNICYPYDCGLSQRVELSFTLKDDNKSLDKLFNIATEVK